MHSKINELDICICLAWSLGVTMQLFELLSSCGGLQQLNRHPRQADSVLEISRFQDFQICRFPDFLTKFPAVQMSTFV